MEVWLQLSRELTEAEVLESGLACVRKEQLWKNKRVSDRSEPNMSRFVLGFTSGLKPDAHDVELPIDYVYTTWIWG